MPRITTPQNQQLLTNVAVVRMKRGGKRFEIAAYPNQVQAWRSGVETDLSEVLQTDRVYTNVSHGKFAKKQDLLKSFGTDNEEEVCKMVLEKGEIQISAAERQLTLDRLFKEVAAVVAEKCINTETSLPLTATYVERAMKELNFNLNPSRPAKQQALVVIAALKDNLPVQRARMRLRLSAADAAVVQARLQADGAACKLEPVAGEDRAMVVIDPGSYRAVDEVASGEVEIIDTAVVDIADDSADTTVRDSNTPNNRSAAAAGAPAEAAAAAGGAKAAAGGAKVAKGLTCKNCDSSFASKEEHREHFRSDWHKYNMKMKSQGRDLVSEVEYEFEKLQI